MSERFTNDGFTWGCTWCREKDDKIRLLTVEIERLTRKYEGPFPSPDEAEIGDTLGWMRVVHKGRGRPRVIDWEDTDA